MKKTGRALPRRRAGKRELTVRVPDRRAAELLKLEMQRLARRLGLSVASVRIRRVERRSKTSSR